jgi:O-antigen/teichoic acid export membrane protein
MNLKLRALKNVGANWLGAGTTLVVGFFLSPFILHRLGDDAYGLWVLMFSLTGYYGLLDLGVRSSVVKYVAQFVASHDHERLCHTINTTIFVCGCAGTLVLGVTALVAWHVNSLFQVSPAFLHDARILSLMVGVAVALGLPLSLFGGVLEGLQRFDFISLTQMVMTLLRALLIVQALTHGLGLLTVALITLSLPLVSSAVYAAAVFRALPLEFGMQFVDRATFLQTFRYGSYSFIGSVAFRLRFQGDAVIIGAMLSPAAITSFSIGEKLNSYSLLLITGLGQIFTPMSSQFDEAGDRQQLRKVFLLGNRACALTVFPIGVTLAVLGKSVIDVWVGPRYEFSYLVLLILLIPSVLWDIQASSRSILYGLGRHQTLVVVLVIEGMINVALSVALIRYWGIIGDALGSAIPLACTALFFLPRHLCRLLDVSLRTFVVSSYLLPAALCLPLAATLLFVRHLFQARTYPQLLLQVVAGGLAYGAGLLWFFLTREPMGIKLRQGLALRVRQVL